MIEIFALGPFIYLYLSAFIRVKMCEAKYLIIEVYMSIEILFTNGSKASSYVYIIPPAPPVVLTNNIS